MQANRPHSRRAGHLQGYPARHSEHLLKERRVYGHNASRAEKVDRAGIQGLIETFN